MCHHSYTTPYVITTDCLWYRFTSTRQFSIHNYSFINKAQSSKSLRRHCQPIEKAKKVIKSSSSILKVLSVSTLHFTNHSVVLTSLTLDEKHVKHSEKTDSITSSLINSKSKQIHDYSKTVGFGTKWLNIDPACGRTMFGWCLLLQVTTSPGLVTYDIRFLQRFGSCNHKVLVLVDVYGIFFMGNSKNQAWEQGRGKAERQRG